MIVQAVEEQKQFIENLVKNNPKYVGNEDLLDDFVSESYERSHVILSGVSEPERIKPYLLKVVNTAILGVLKGNSRIQKTSQGYIKNKEISIDSDFKCKTVKFDVVDTKINFEENILDKNFLENIIKCVKKLDERNPLNAYMRIFYMKYYKNMKQKEMSELLNLSQSEISKRLYEIIEYIKKE